VGVELCKAKKGQALFESLRVDNNKNLENIIYFPYFVYCCELFYRPVLFSPPPDLIYGSFRFEIRRFSARVQVQLDSFTSFVGHAVKPVIVRDIDCPYSDWNFD